MDVGVLTTLGSAVGVMLGLLGVITRFRREIRREIRGEIREVRSEIREVRSEIRIVDDRVRDLQVDMGIVKYCLGIGDNPSVSKVPIASAS